MDEVKGVLCPVVHLFQEDDMSLLIEKVVVTYLIHLLKWQQPTDHVLVCQLAQGAKIEVVLPGMPTPCRLEPLHRQPHWPPNVQLEVV